MLRRLLLFLFFVSLFSFSSFSQGLYCGGAGDGFAFAEVNQVLFSTNKQLASDISIIISPNPVISGNILNVTIELSNFIGDIQIQVVNSLLIIKKEVILSTRNNRIEHLKISTKDFSPGIYFLIITANGYQTNEKIIIF